MKKNTNYWLFIAFVFSLSAACNNNAAEAEKTEVKTVKKTAVDTSETKVGVKEDGVSVQTKGGTQVSVGGEGGEVKTKDLDIQVKPKQLPE